jgi:flagellar biogenesis protein FliO
MKVWRLLAFGMVFGALSAAVLADDPPSSSTIDVRGALANGTVAIGPDEPLETVDSTSSPAADREPLVDDLPALPVSIEEQAERSPLESKPLGHRAEPSIRISRSGSEGSSVDGAAELGTQISEFAKVAGALAAVLVLAFAARAIVRRISGVGMAGARPSGVVEILARYPLARGQQFVVVKFARRIVLAHAHGTGMSPLCEMSDPEEVAALLARLEAGANGKTAGKFRQTLKQFQTEHRTVSVRESERLIPSRGDGAEIVDLTRVGGRGLLGFFRGGAAS